VTRAWRGDCLESSTCEAKRKSSRGTAKNGNFYGFWQLQIHLGKQPDHWPIVG